MPAPDVIPLPSAAPIVPGLSLLEQYQRHTGTEDVVLQMPAGSDTWGRNRFRHDADGDRRDIDRGGSSVNAAAPVEEEMKRFSCCVCGFRCHFEQRGRRFPLARGVEFKEAVYVLRDPLRTVTTAAPRAAGGGAWGSGNGGGNGGSTVGPGLLVLGADCDVCRKQVCQAKSCSAFAAGRRQCAKCAVADAVAAHSAA